MSESNAEAYAETGSETETQIVDDSSEKKEETAEDILDDVEDAAEDAKEAVEDAAEIAEEAAEDAADAAHDAATEAKGAANEVSELKTCIEGLHRTVNDFREFMESLTVEEKMDSPEPITEPVKNSDTNGGETENGNETVDGKRSGRRLNSPVRRRRR